MDTLTLINSFLHNDIKNIIMKLLERFDENDLQEIRIRLNKPIEVKLNSKNYLLLENGTTTNNIKYAFVVNTELFTHTLNKITQHSMYAFQDEIKNGFITLKGAHRVGVIGTCAIENGNIKSVKDITSLNIRFAHSIYGVSSSIKKIYENDITNTLIVSPPCCGKTTLLRDLLRVFSDEYGKTVGVVDERSELCNLHYVGVRTDVITNCPKSVGMVTLLRTMSPYVICVDEIGKKEDVDALFELFNCGVKVVATIHAKGIEELKKKENIKEILRNKYFDNFIVLNSDFTLKPKMYNADFVEVFND